MINQFMGFFILVYLGFQVAIFGVQSAFTQLKRSVITRPEIQLYTLNILLV